jgi:hypothetical protein
MQGTLLLLGGGEERAFTFKLPTATFQQVEKK